MMPNWSVQATAGVIDSSNPNNIVITFTATNSATEEVFSQTASNSNWTVAKAQSMAQDIVANLNTRDALRAATAANLPGIQAYIAQNNVLASG